jgi:hypothetical protein
MFELSGKIQDVSIDYRGNGAVLTIAINEKNQALKCFDELHQTDKISVKIDKYREKRSLNANNYAWSLITQIADILRQSKEDVYFDMLCKYGQSELISVKAHIPIGEYVKYYTEAGESTLNNTLFKHYKVYKGSSEFDTREMSIFIDGVIDEAKQMGIQTETPEKLEKIKALWG